MARSSLADFGSESTSEEESEVGQQRFGRVALYSKLLFCYTFSTKSYT